MDLFYITEYDCSPLKDLILLIWGIIDSWNVILFEWFTVLVQYVDRSSIEHCVIGFIFGEYK